MVFVVALALLAALTAGLAYFQFVIKPGMVKGFITAAFAPKPTTVNAEAARIEQWRPELTAIGTLRAYQGILVAPQVAGVVSAIHFDSGGDVKAGDLLINLDDSVEQDDLANGLAQLKNADATLARQKTLVAQGNTPQSTVDTALATRDSAAATVERTRAIIAQKALRAPFDGRIGLRNADLGQFAAVGTPLATLQKLDPIYADFPVPEEALATIAVDQDVTMTVAAIPGRTFNGKVKAIDARVSADSRNVTIRAQFDNPQRNLLPGMFANITVTTGAPRRRADRAAYGDRLQPVRRQCLRRRARAEVRSRARRPRRRLPQPAAWSSSGASSGSGRREESGSRSWTASRRANRSSAPGRSNCRRIRRSPSTTARRLAAPR